MNDSERIENEFQEIIDESLERCDSVECSPEKYRITVFANSEEFRAHHSEAPRKPTREEKRAAAQAEYVRISDTATKGAGQTPYIQKKLAKLRATVEKLGGFK